MTDEMLRQAAKESFTFYMETVTRNGNPAHTFHPSPAFEQKIGRLAHRASRPTHYKLLQRVASVAVAAVLAGGAWLAVSKDARAEFVAWARQMFENSVVYDFYGTYHEESLPEYVIAPLPDGFVESDVIGGDTMYIRVYENDKDIVIFSYMIMSEDSTMSLFSDGHNYESVQVGPYSGDFYEMTNSEETNELIWFDTENNIVFQISAFMNKDAMLALAECVEKK